MTHLIFMRDKEAVLKRPIEGNRITIGRDTTCDIQFTEPEISRLHCILERQNGFYRLTDQSRNGTFVNQKRSSEVSLRPGDTIGIGPWSLEIISDPTPATEETFVHEKQKKGISLCSMLGVSKAMRNAFQLIRKAAASHATVCLVGESGTGKELAARSIHDLGERRDKPFVAVNCGAIPQNLIESLLFGHERGSFTGATDRHSGVFEEANGGTLFLDEIGEMPVDLQTRLLRVLETQTLRRVGGKSDIKVNVRLIAATNRNLDEMVADGSFRRDLFYRLYIFPITLAPLRERRDDIQLLAKHFLQMLSPTGEQCSLSNEAITKMESHDWRGNVRELKNVIQRAILLSKNKNISAKEIECSPPIQTAVEMGELNLEDQEKWSIIDALKKTRGNQAKAARHLGIARTTLASKLRRHKLDTKNWR
ncbi:MAG: sigma 54-interacting transcriptional regulator [Deltaproteobacteria bacterium]|nr:sigma 54-interacting transcriptional regulator [Deltaproteobacteria bacterium]